MGIKFNPFTGKLDIAQTNQTILSPDVASIVEYPDRESFPSTGRDKRLYIALDTGLPWRWSNNSQSYVLLIQIIDAGVFE
jgi:hypothetical protein